MMSGPTSPFAAPNSPFSAKKGQNARELEDRERNRRLCEWLTENGVYMKDRSGWGQAPHGLVVANETTDEGEPSGRGFLAKRELTAGEPVFEIPEELCLTRRVAVETCNLPEEMNEYLALAVLLIHERARGESSFFKPYLDVLPEGDDLNPMFTWSEEDLEALKGSPALSACRSLKKKIRSEFEQMDADLFEPRRSEFTADIYDYEAWEWAFAILFSRAILFNPLSTDEQELALVPYADLLNHSPFCTAFIERQTRLFSKKKYVALFTDRNYQKMEQVYTTYGQKSNAELAILYGFVVDRNPYDSIDVGVSLDESDDLYERKAEYLKSIGKPVTIEFPLYVDRAPVELIEFLRFCVANEEELEVGAFNQLVSARNELAVADTIVGACESALAAYNTTFEEDNKLMGDRKMYKMLSKNQRMAIKLQRAEKKILLRTVADIERRRDKPENLFT